MNFRREAAIFFVPVLKSKKKTLELITLGNSDFQRGLDPQTPQFSACGGLSPEYELEFIRTPPPLKSTDLFQGGVLNWNTPDL